MANDLRSAIQEALDAVTEEQRLAEFLTRDLRPRSSRARRPALSADVRDAVHAAAAARGAKPRAAVAGPCEAASSFRTATPDAEEGLLEPPPRRAAARAAERASIAASSSVAEAGPRSALDAPHALSAPPLPVPLPLPRARERSIPEPARAAETPCSPEVELTPASATPDTLQPHLITQGELDDEDLAVLPRRPTLAFERAFGALPGALVRALPPRRLAAAGALVLAAAVLLFLRWRGDNGIQTELAAMRPEVELPPPAPSEEVSPPPEPAAAAPTREASPAPPAPRAARERTPKPAAALPAADSTPFGASGPAIARYPDLPPRVLTRLAGENEPPGVLDASGAERGAASGSPSVGAVGALGASEAAPGVSAR